MNAWCVVLFLAAAIAAGSAAPNAAEEKSTLELFHGVFIEKNHSGEEKLNVKFEPGELKEAARTFEEARGKVKKYAPILAGVGVKIVAVLGVVFGALTLLVTNALVVAKLAFFVVAGLGLQKFLSGGLPGLSSKLPGFPSPAPQWAPPSAPAASYPYARSSSNVHDGIDLAYKSQLPS